MRNKIVKNWTNLQDRRKYELLSSQYCVVAASLLYLNPSIRLSVKSNWANQYVNTPDDSAYRHKSDYRSVPIEWLGEMFVERAEHLKATNERAYNHEYLGLPVGLGTNIFDMLEIRTITDEEIQSYQSIYQGQDFGWWPDPKAFIRAAYVANKKKNCVIR